MPDEDGRIRVGDIVAVIAENKRTVCRVSNIAGNTISFTIQGKMKFDIGSNVRFMLSRPTDEEVKFFVDTEDMHSSDN